MTTLEDKSDQALLNVAKKCDGGMPQILEHFFGFLGRRTEFFAKNTPEECEKQLMNAYERQCQQMEKIMRMKQIQREQDEIRERKLLRQQIAMEKAKKAEEEAKKALEDVPKAENGENVEKSESKPTERLMPNEGNGCDLPNYKWTQTLDKIELTVPFKVDFALKSRDVIIEFKKQHLKVGLRGWEPVIDGNLFNEIVINDECTWSLAIEQKTATILMPKKRTNQFWNKLTTTDPEININV